MAGLGTPQFGSGITPPPAAATPMVPPDSPAPPPELQPEPLNEAQNQGGASTVLELPVRAADAAGSPDGSLTTQPPAAPADMAQVDPPAKKATFLLVDDNAVNLKMISHHMNKLGHIYDTAADGQQAFDAVRNSGGQYKCIFMDISMPVMDGFESTRLIRGFEKEKHLPRSHIFALSGLASESAQQEAFASGIDLFLTKPVKLKELNRILEERQLGTET